MRQKIKAESKWVKMAPRKIRRVIDAVRGAPPAQALALLRHMPHKGARILEKVIKSAVANAKQNYKLSEEKLVISEMFANKGVTSMRYQPRARGRMFPLKKRTAHVRVYVSPAPPEAGEEKG